MTAHSTGAAFIERISAEALDSTAVNHPYLDALRDADFPDYRHALKDFAFQYGLYSSRFTRYVDAVIEQLSDAGHRRILESNLAEEQGDTHGVDLPAEVLATVIGRPHASLFRRFQQALDIDDDHHDAPPGDHAGRRWSKAFLELCELDECIGVGAIGIGTELVVSSIYNQVLVGLREHSGLSMTEHVFFDLHSQCDEEHADQMLTIAADLARDNESCNKIAYGARKAIELRSAFWDEMLQRARRQPSPSATVTGELSSVGY